MIFWDLTSSTNETLSSSTTFGVSSLRGGGGEGMDIGEGRKGEEGGIVHKMDTAHESNVWSLEWHPFGHLLCSGSNDHMTRFWERARPADSSPNSITMQDLMAWVALRSCQPWLGEEEEEGMTVSFPGWEQR